MRRRLTRFRRRPKRRFIWIGGLVGDAFNSTNEMLIPDLNSAPPNPTWTSIILLNNAELSTATDLLLHRVLFGFTVHNTTILPVLLEMQLEVVQTELDGLTPMATAPDLSDPDAQNKRLPMWSAAWAVGDDGIVGMSQGHGDAVHTTLNDGNPYDIRVKRKINGDEALHLKFGSASMTNETGSDNSLAIDYCWWRCLVSGGRR